MLFNMLVLFWQTTVLFRVLLEKKYFIAHCKRRPPWARLKDHIVCMTFCRTECQIWHIVILLYCSRFGGEKKHVQTFWFLKNSLRCIRALRASTLRTTLHLVRPILVLSFPAYIGLVSTWLTNKAIQNHTYCWKSVYLNRLAIFYPTLPRHPTISNILFRICHDAVINSAQDCEIAVILL